jgi:hypothetical protein
MLLQLNPPIPLFCPGRGPGMAVLVIDYSQDHDLLWTVIADRGGEIWSLRNSEVRGVENISLGRTKSAPPEHIPPGHTSNA